MRVVLTGGGLVGLLGGMLLAGDGHEVLVLERDPAEPPTDPEVAWEAWERRGVGQFRQLHYFLPRFRLLLEAELPHVAAALRADGAEAFHPLGAPDEVTGGVRDGDDDFVALTARRPVVEAAVARCADATPGLDVRRGVAVVGLVARPGDGGAPPHVTGVRLADGSEVAADLVVDSSGRRSQLPSWLADVGARPPLEEQDDCGFVYYGRYFRSADGSLPPVLGPLLQAYGTVSALTLPADHGTWGVGLVTSAADTALRGLKDVERWEAVTRSLPLVAHWADGEPLDDGVAVMAKIEDRHRRFVVDGAPVATGVLAVADAWACTNPSVGRGASMGLLHAVALRDLLRTGPVDDPVALSVRWDAVTGDVVEPHYRGTLDYDRGRLGEIDAALAGEDFDGGPLWEVTKAFEHATGQDPDVLRAFLSIQSLLKTPDEVLAEPGMLDRILRAGAGWRAAPALGPDRAELVAAAAR